jgi:hypothetical protein
MMMTRKALAPLCLLALLGCGDPTTPAGTAMGPNEEADMSGDGCRRDGDCPSGQLCAEGSCQPDALACLRNSDCAPGYLCARETLRCTPANLLERPCQTKEDCFSDESCVEGVCAATSPDPDALDLPPEDLSTDAPREDFSLDLPPEDLSEPDLTPDFSEPDLAPDDLPPDHSPEDLAEPDLTLDLPPEDMVTDVVVDDVETDLPPEDMSTPDLPPDLPPEDLPEPDLTPDLPPDLPPEDAPEPDLAPDLPPEDAPEPDLAPDLPPEDLPEPDLEPDLPPEDVPEPDLAPDLPPEDMPEDMITEDLPPEDMPDEDMEPEPDVFEPPPMPPPGQYAYQRMEIGGLGAIKHVAFHPSGDYAIALESRNVVHVIDWATGSATRYTLSAPGGYVWEDLAFDPSGARALLVGWRDVTGTPGAVVAFEDAAWRALAPQEELFVPIALTFDPIHALRYPREGGDAILLGRRGTRSPYTVVLRDLDAEVGRFGGLATTTTSDAGCDDLDLVQGRDGEPGILVVCGGNGADVHFYSLTRGLWEANPGNNNLGNTSSVGAHPGQSYALVISWSGGGAVYRFEGGLLGGYSDAIRFSTRQIDAVSFQQEGQRALIYGGSFFGSAEDVAVIYEFRHDAFTCARPNTADCDLKPVHITSFDQPPYNGISNTKIHDAAWRPGCDGGLLGVGYQDFRTDVGQLIVFQVEGARGCR